MVLLKANPVKLLNILRTIQMYQSLNGITEDRSGNIVADLRSNTDVPIKDDSLNGVTEDRSDDIVAR